MSGIIQNEPSVSGFFSSQNVFEMYPCCRVQQRFVPLILFIGHVYHRLCDCSSVPVKENLGCFCSTKL